MKFVSYGPRGTERAGVLLGDSYIDLERLMQAFSIDEFISYVSTFVTQYSGNGTITHLALALFSLRSGIQTQLVPYKGTAPALTDLVAGNVEFTIGTINTALQFVREGRLCAIAVPGLTRASSLPAVPTLDETGMKGFEASAWQGVMAPAGTPPAIVNRLSTEISKALARPDLSAQLAPQDAEVPGWVQVIKDTGTKIQ